MKKRTYQRVVVLIFFIFFLYIYVLLRAVWLFPNTLEETGKVLKDEVSNQKIVHNKILAHHITPMVPHVRAANAILNFFKNEDLILKKLPDHILWTSAYTWIKDYGEFHPKTDPNIELLIQKLSSAHIHHTYINETAEDKWEIILLLDDNQKVQFIPKSYNADYVVLGPVSEGFGNHNSHIVAFHLNRMFGWGRVPITVGRRLSLEHDLLPFASDNFKKAIFKKDDHLCIRLGCATCNDPVQAVCADATGSLEGALVLSPLDNTLLTRLSNPWAQSGFIDSSRTLMEDICGGQQRNTQIIGMLEVSIFDFLMGNPTRGHFTLTSDLSGRQKFLQIDNGRGLRNPFLDDAYLLAPLQHCCRIRRTFFLRLQQLSGGALSLVLSTRLARDPLPHLISAPTLTAISRRLDSVLSTVRRCIAQRGDRAVLIDRDSATLLS